MNLRDEIDYWFIELKRFKAKRMSANEFVGPEPLPEPKEIVWDVGGYGSNKCSIHGLYWFSQYDPLSASCPYCSDESAKDSKEANRKW